MNPNIHNEPPKSAKATLLTLASLLVLAGIVGITLFLYIQNLTTQSQKNANVVGNNIKPVYCNNPKVYKSIDEALREPENVCTLDLSFQKLSSLPKDIIKLKNLTSLYLTGNNFTQIPSGVFELKNLERLDVNTNQLTSVPKDLAKLTELKTLNLTNNNLKTLPREVIDMNLTSIMLHGNDKSLILYEK